MKILLRTVIPVVDVCHGGCGDGAVCAVDAVTARQHHNSTATPHRVLPLVSSKHPGSFHTNENDNPWLLDDGKAGRSNFHITEDPLKCRFSCQRSLVDTQNVHAQGFCSHESK